MKIGGLMKLTLLDFPEHVACTVFLSGCNFRCPFCHNRDLAMASSPDEISQEEFFAFLKKRQGVLQGVCVSGGEPLINDDIFEFLKKIKDMGYKVKLDTNGSFPERLRRIIDAELCDYVAMDVKNSPDKYPQTAGGGVTFDKVSESIAILKESRLPHEFRTTTVKDFHTKDDIAEIAAYLGEEEKYFIQPFRDGESVLVQGLSEFSDEEIKELVETAKKYAPKAAARGTDI